MLVVYLALNIQGRLSYWLKYYVWDITPLGIDENWAPYCFTFSTDRFLPINYILPKCLLIIGTQKKKAFVSEIRNVALELNFHGSLSHYMGLFQGRKTCSGLPRIMVWCACIPADIFSKDINCITSVAQFQGDKRFCLLKYSDIWRKHCIIFRFITTPIM